MRHSSFVRGVTTAASLWFVTVLGLAFGEGLFALGFLGTGVAMATLFVLPRFEKHIRTDWYATLTVTATLEALNEAELRQRIEALGPVVKATKLNFDLDKRHKTVICELKLKKDQVFELSSQIVAEMIKCPGVLHVRWF